MQHREESTWGPLPAVGKYIVMSLKTMGWFRFTMKYTFLLLLDCLAVYQIVPDVLTPPQKFIKFHFNFIRIQEI